ncbi:hypothetical protein ACKKBF_B30690 [Auxenochlorella protothecoides x Auxenochlorella symbiontica]
MVNLGTPLPDPPGDGITSLNFVDSGNLLLASSWDSTLRLYAADQGELRGTHERGAPILDACPASESVSYSAGLDGRILRHDWESQAQTLLGSHSEPVRCLTWLPDLQLLASAGWDSRLKIWDPRIPGSDDPVAEMQLPDKAFSMTAGRERLVVATAGRHIHVFDLTKLTNGVEPEQARESSLKHQTRCVRMYPDGSGFATASIEGRVAMEYFDLGDAQAKRYAFKCHRASEGGRDVVFPVNTLAFHQTHGTFATGGCDGVVSIWDGEHKKRLAQFTGYPTSIAALAFNLAGNLLAVASSYTFEKGDVEHPADSIYIRPVEDAEVQPRVKVNAGP